MTAARNKLNRYTVLGLGLGGVSAGGTGVLLLWAVQALPLLGHLFLLAGLLAEIALGVLAVAKRWVELADRRSALRQRERRDLRRDQMLSELTSRIPDGEVAGVVEQLLHDPPPLRRPPDDHDDRKER